MELHEAIVRNLEMAKDKRGMSTAELARRCNMQRLQLTNVFRGRRILKADELVRLCYVLGVSFPQLDPTGLRPAKTAEGNVHGDASRASMASR